MPEQGERAPVHVIGVSIPRSGHNFAVRLLQAAIPDDLFYCEYYGVPGCCQAVPCARRGTRPITFQKSHDFDLNLPTDLPGVHYLAMYRSPVPAILSNRELYAEEYGDEVASNRDEYAVWLGRNAEYYVTFYERWIRTSAPNKTVVDYDEIAARPGEEIQRLLERIGRTADATAVEQAVIATTPHGGLFGERPYVPRSIETSTYLDRELIATFESIVLHHLPRLESRRVFEPVEFHGTVTWLVFAALRALRSGDLARARQHIQAAAELEPENALLRYEHAIVLMKEERFLEAQRELTLAAERFPTHRPILDALATVSLAAGDAASALAPMAALAAATPTLVHQLRLVLVATHAGDERAGGEILEQVEREHPDDAAVWRLVAEVWHTRGNYQRALAALDTAIRLAPLQGDLYAQRGQILRDAGQPGAAAVALREALAIDAGQPRWWEALIGAYLASRDRPEARRAIDEARGRFPFAPEFQTMLGEVERQRGGRPRATLRRRVTIGGEPMTPAGRRRPGTTPGRRRGRQGQPSGSVSSAPGDVARLQVQLSQLRVALGAAERRQAETEVTKQRQLEEAWDEAVRLSESLHELDAAFKRQNLELQDAWREARLAWDRAQAGWEQAQSVADELQRMGQAAEAAWAQARLLDRELHATSTRLTATVAWGELQEVTRLRLTTALEQVPALLARACDGSGTVAEVHAKFLLGFVALQNDLAQDLGMDVTKTLDAADDEVRGLLERFMDPSAADGVAGAASGEGVAGSPTDDSDALAEGSRHA
jgi:tetratricopeptide (TPR) repeat protein